jgi:amino acid permease
MNKQKIFLLSASIGLFPIALSYGAAPGQSLSALFSFSVDTVNETHIFRAVMGLYLAFVVFWLMGVKDDKLTRPAIMGLVVFMLGLALGRTLSLLVDGPAHWLLMAYALIEYLFAFVGIRLLKNSN